jgi:type IV pilus assembly protein PilQ
MVVEGNILRIGKVDELAKEAEQRRKLQEAREMDGKLEVIIRPLSYAKAADVSKILEKQMSKRGEIQVDARSNSLIISEVPDRVRILDNLIESLDTANQQVSIEARIVESKQGYAKAFGIQWGFSGLMSPRYGNQTTLKFPNSIQAGGALFPTGYAINLPLNSTAGPNTAVGISMGNVAGTFDVDVVLQALESKGNARVLSSPRTTTQNNVEAVLVSGIRVPVQTQQPNGTYSMVYLNAALELKVKPQITAEGTIITDVDIKNDAPDWDPNKRVQGNPPIVTQSSQNSVMVKDGGTIVIGGLYRVETNDGVQSVPLLGKIPLLGNLFRNKNKSFDKRELLIFITPRIVK